MSPTYRVPSGAPEDLRVAVVAVPTAEARVVGDVAGGLLEVGHEPTPLEHLGEQVRGLLAGQVHATELGDRVVAVLEEDPVVELLGPPQARPWRRWTASPEMSSSPTNSSRKSRRRLFERAGVAGEQRALHHLGQVHQREHRAVEVGEVAPEDIRLVGRELLGDVDGHGWSWTAGGTRRLGPGDLADRGPAGGLTRPVHRARELGLHRVQDTLGRATDRRPSRPWRPPRRARPGRPRLHARARRSPSVWMATPGGATAIIGWIDGTTWLTLPMSVLPTTAGSASGRGPCARARPGWPR